MAALLVDTPHHSTAMTDQAMAVCPQSKQMRKSGYGERRNGSIYFKSWTSRI